MRILPLLLLLAGTAFAQDLAAESDRNKLWSAAAGKAEGAAGEADKRARAIAERRTNRQAQLDQLIVDYGSEATRPEREVVVQAMQDLQTDLERIRRERGVLAERQEKADRALEEVVTQVGDWQANLGAVVGDAGNESWAAVRDARGAIVKRWLDAATARTRHLENARNDLDRTREILVRMRHLHQRNNLTLRGRSHVSWESTRDAFADLPELAAWLGGAMVGVKDYFQGPQARAGAIRWLVTSLFAIALALLLALALRRYAARTEAAAGTATQQRVLRAIARFGRRGLHLALIYFVPVSAAAMLDLAPDTRSFLNQIAAFLTFVYLVWSVYREILRPGRPEAALLQVDDWARRRVAFAIQTILLAAILLRPLEIGLRCFGYRNLGAIELLGSAQLVVAAILLSGVLFRRRLFEALLPKADVTWARLVRGMATALRPVLVLLMPAIALLHLARFEILADMLTRTSAALLGSVLATALLYQVAKAIAIGWAHRRYGEEATTPRSRGQVTLSGVLFLLRVFFFLFGIWVFAALSGSSVEDLRLTLDVPLPFQTGEGAPTYWALCAAVAIFCLFFFGTRHAKEVLQAQVLERTNLDRSTQYTIATLLGYVVLSIGVVTAVRQVFNLSDLGTIVAALSVGIGFGLQEIVSNFISGIVLLFERPIRVGDTIEVGPNRGLIRQINMRATTVQTRDNIFILVPNRDLMTQTVVNYGYDDPKIRLRIPIGVSYGSDPEQVREVLLQVAADTDKILRHPIPQVEFTAMGDSSLNFILLAWIQRPEQGPAITSIVNFAIFAALKKAGIEIPFPQRDIHIRSEPPREDRAD